MIGVGEQHLRTAVEQIFAALRADRRVRAHRHESRSQHLIVPGCKTRRACPRVRSGGFEFEFQPPHGGYLTASLAAGTMLFMWSNSGRADCAPLSVDLSRAAK